MYVALNAATGEMVAAKQVEIPRMENSKVDSRQVTVTEVSRRLTEILKELDHPNVVLYLGFEETPRYVTMLVLLSVHHCHTANTSIIASLNIFRMLRFPVS